MSRKNKKNRTNSKLVVSHHGGSASSFQHYNNLKKLKNGIAPSMAEVYLHTHCAREDGKSHVVAQIESAALAASEPNENTDDNRIRDPSLEVPITREPDYDPNSLHFTNWRAKSVYVEVKDMMADQANSNVDESTMFLTAVGGSSHGRVRGFGSMLQDKVPTATTRAMSKHSSSSVSGLTNTEGQVIQTREELEMLLADRDRRLDEERA